VASDQGKPLTVRTGEISVERTDAGLTVLTISGEHDLSTAPDLKRRLNEAISDGNPIVVDLSPAAFVDSSILGAILDARRRADEASLGFAVAQSDGSAAVGRVLEVTGLRSELPVHGARDEAAAAIGGASGENPS
jgi:anti-sigma B factor antagonist